MSSRNGDDDTQYEIGDRYYTGEGVKKNKTVAQFWFEQSAKQGNKSAMCALRRYLQ